MSASKAVHAFVVRQYPEAGTEISTVLPYTSDPFGQPESQKQDAELISSTNLLQR